MSGKYILDADNNPLPCEDILVWARWYEDSLITDERRLLISRIGSVEISTVFLGLNHRVDDGPPILWETMVFGGDLDGEQRRYVTRADAIKGHHELVAQVQHAQFQQRLFWCLIAKVIILGAALAWLLWR